MYISCSVFHKTFNLNLFFVYVKNAKKDIIKQKCACLNLFTKSLTQSHTNDLCHQFAIVECILFDLDVIQLGFQDRKNVTHTQMPWQLLEKVEHLLHNAHSHSLRTSYDPNKQQLIKFYIILGKCTGGDKVTSYDL